MAIQSGDLKFYKPQYIADGSIVGGDIGNGTGSSGWANAVELTGTLSELLLAHLIDSSNDKTYYAKFFVGNANTDSPPSNAYNVTFYAPNLLNCLGVEDATDINNPGQLGDGTGKYLKFVFGSSADDTNSYQLKISGLDSAGNAYEAIISLDGSGSYYSSTKLKAINAVFYQDTSSNNVIPANGDINVYMTDDTSDTNIKYLGKIPQNLSYCAVGNIVFGWDSTSSNDTTTTNSQTAPETGGTSPHTITFHYANGHNSSDQYNGGILQLGEIKGDHSLDNSRKGIWVKQYVWAKIDPESDIQVNLTVTYM